MLLKRNRVKLEADTWLVDVEIKLDIPTNVYPTKWSCLFSNLHSLVLAKLKSSNKTELLDLSKDMAQIQNNPE